MSTDCHCRIGVEKTGEMRYNEINKLEFARRCLYCEEWYFTT